MIAAALLLSFSQPQVPAWWLTRPPIRPLVLAPCPVEGSLRDPRMRRAMMAALRHDDIA